jgi:hypothetical protein
MKVLSLSFQHIYILKTMQKSFIPMKLSLLPQNSYHLSLYKYGATSTYLMLTIILIKPIESGLTKTILS